MTRAEARLQGGKDRVGGPELGSSFKTESREDANWGMSSRVENRFFFPFFKERVCSSIFVSKGKGSGRSEEIGSSRDGEVLGRREATE